MERFSLILTLCSLWSISVVVLAQEATTGSVRGHVVDISTTHLPIEGVRVVIVSTDGVETEVETDSNGKYKTMGLIPGHYLISAYKEGYWEYKNESVTVIAGGDHYVPLKMAGNRTTGIVRGNVLEASEAHLPIEGVRVVIVDVGGFETKVKTDSNGEFKIIGLDPGRHLLNIYKDGYSDHVERVTVVAGGNHYVPMKMTKTGWTYLLTQKVGVSLWLLLFCLGVALALGYLIGRAGRRSDY